MIGIPHQEAQYRVVVAMAALLSGVIVIAIISLVLPKPDSSADFVLANILFDRSRDIYPLTLQNAMWLIFFVGLGELWVRFHAGNTERRLLGWGLLPEDDASMLRASDLAPIYARVVGHPASRQRFLPRLISRVSLQFQASQSVEQANSLLNSSLELLQHEVELRYNMLRYIMWFIPTLGFIGTVVGIALALAAASSHFPDITDGEAVQIWVAELTGNLGLAFNTTFIALLMAAILVFLMHIAQGREESALNGAGQYCLDNLINRLYEDRRN